MTPEPQFRYPWAMWLLDVKLWVDKADWRSWIAHAVIGLGVILIYLPVYWLFWWIGLSPLAAVALVIWGLREGEQLAFELMHGEDIKWVDHIGDILAPTILTQVVFG